MRWGKSRHSVHHQNCSTRTLRCKVLCCEPRNFSIYRQLWNLLWFLNIVQVLQRCPSLSFFLNIPLRTSLKEQRTTVEEGRCWRVLDLRHSDQPNSRSQMQSWGLDRGQLTWEALQEAGCSSGPQDTGQTRRCWQQLASLLHLPALPWTRHPGLHWVQSRYLSLQECRCAEGLCWDCVAGNAGGLCCQWAHHGQAAVWDHMGDQWRTFGRNSYMMVGCVCIPYHQIISNTSSCCTFGGAHCKWKLG